ncbi:MAG: hypothetical protein L3J92_06030 [Thermoplasmata archaeon]|jgi:hypothetical protein|nr:hypothetical protein [Thermoplasmata archaeon]
MGETPNFNASRRYRRARRLHGDRRGVVAVIGTLLALLVFFTLFGIFLTQYLPLWMTDNESQFTAQAAYSFALFKSNVDSQYQFSPSGPQTLGTPFVVSSQGVPLLAQPTQATLIFLPSSCPNGFYAKGIAGATAANYGQPVSSTKCVFANTTLSQGPGGSGLYSQRIATGVLQMNLPNRYYTAEQFYFEDDAVIQTQSGGYTYLTVNPPLNVTDNAKNITVTASLLQLYGNASTFIGSGSQEVYSHSRFSQEVTSNGLFVASNSSYLPYVYTFEIGTEYPCAWSPFLVKVMQGSGVPTASYSFTPYAGSCNNPTGLTTELTLKIYNVDYSALFTAGVQVSLGVGGT